MRKYFGTVQKRVGLLISVLDLIVVITNFIFATKRSDLFFALKDMGVWLMLLVGIPFFLSIFFENRFYKFLQFSLFILIGSINIMQDFTEFYGPSLFLISWLLMRQYGFLDKHRILKNSLMLGSLVVLSQISANVNTAEGAYAGFSTLWYALFLILMLLVIWQDILKNQEDLKKENRFLKINYKELEAQLTEIESEKKPYDLKAAKISPAEERVIKVLTIYKASNREIAERLDIAESTVKLHLYNIYNKIGVDNRFAIIDLCKYNFS